MGWGFWLGFFFRFTLPGNGCRPRYLHGLHSFFFFFSRCGEGAGRVRGAVSRPALFRIQRRAPSPPSGWPRPPSGTALAKWGCEASLLSLFTVSTEGFEVVQFASQERRRGRRACPARLSLAINPYGSASLPSHCIG